MNFRGHFTSQPFCDSVPDSVKLPAQAVSETVRCPLQRAVALLVLPKYYLSGQHLTMLDLSHSEELLSWNALEFCEF